MVMVNTTLWIDCLDGTATPETEWLDREAEQRRLAPRFARIGRHHAASRGPISSGRDMRRPGGVLCRSAYSGLTTARLLQQVAVPASSYRAFFGGAGWRYAASVAGVAEICRSAQRSLVGSFDDDEGIPNAKLLN